MGSKLTRAALMVSVAFAGLHCASNPRPGAQSSPTAAARAPLSAPPPTAPALPPEPSAAPAASEASASAPALVPGTSSEPGWLGVDLGAVPPDQAGVQVAEVFPGSPAETAQLLAGDVILKVDGESVNTPGELVGKVRDRHAGDRLAFMLRRGGQDRLISALLVPRPDTEELLRQRYVDRRAPELSTGQVAAGTVQPSLNSLKGQVVVLEFWASWCGPCHMLMPTLNDWHDRYSAQGVRVIGVTVDPVAEAARSARELGMRYSVIADADGQITRDYRALALPTVFVIDKQGRVREVVVGFQHERMQRLAQLVERLLSES